MSEEELEILAFKDRKKLANLNSIDLLEIIEFLQLDRKAWINQYTKAHNDYVELQQENQKLTHIIEELEEYCFEEQIPDDYPEYNDLIEIKNMVYEEVLNKLKQLQEEE